MAQHDYVIANGTGAAVRSDLNNALAAIVSNNSGATEPATMYAYQWWADTSTGLLKLRNAANNAWITLRELDGTLTIEDGTASSPGLAFADDLNTGIYSPSADQLGITTGGTVRLTTTTTGITSALPVDVPLGTASAPTVTFTGDLNTGIYSPGADQVAISTNGSGRLFVDSSGRVLAGTSTARGNFSNSTDSPLLQIESSDGFGWSVVRNSNSSGGCYVYLAKSRGTGNTVVQSGDVVGGINFEGNDGSEFVTSAQIRVEIDNTPGANDMPGRIVLSTTKDGQSSPTEAMRIDSQQRVGIGTTPSTLLHLASTDPVIRLQDTDTNGFGQITVDNGGSVYIQADEGNTQASSSIRLNVDGSEAVRIDSSRRLLVGTSSSYGVGSSAQAKFQASDTTSNIHASFTDWSTANSGGIIVLGKAKGGSAGNYTIVANNDILGEIRFAGADGTDLETNGALIRAEVDGTPGANDMPGRLVFSTTADGASSPTERARISNAGYFKASTNGTYVYSSTVSHEFNQHNNSNVLQLYGSNTSQSTDGLLFIRAARNTTNNSFYFFDCYNETAAAYKFRIADSGNATNTNNSYGAISDAKLKENIVDAASQWEDLKKLQVRKYNFKEETGQPTHTQIGLIAQEVELVSPGLVSESPDRDREGNDLGTVTKSVNYSVLYMKAVKALQEAMERIEQLEQRLTDAGIA